jgi:hypothetical protein
MVRSLSLGIINGKLVRVQLYKSLDNRIISRFSREVGASGASNRSRLVVHSLLYKPIENYA